MFIFKSILFLATTFFLSAALTLVFAFIVVQVRGASIYKPENEKMMKKIKVELKKDLGSMEYDELYFEAAVKAVCSAKRRQCKTVSNWLTYASLFCTVTGMIFVFFL